MAGVTSLPFDISVLGNSSGTLADGFKLVAQGKRETARWSRTACQRDRQGMEFSIYYWGNR